MKKPLFSLVLLSFVLVRASGAAPGEGVGEPSLAGVTSDRISLDLKGIDVVEALKILSSRGNLNIVIGGNVQGRVTLFLNDVNVQDALEIILISTGLAFERKDDIFYVMTQVDYERTYGESFGGKKEVLFFKLKNTKAANMAKSLEQAKTRLGKIIVDDLSNSVVLMDSRTAIQQMSQIVEKLDQPVSSRIFELKYSKAEDMKAKVFEMLTKDVGTVQVDARSNKLSVTDIESRLDEIGKMVAAFDEKPQQVLIEAKIVQVTLSDEYKLGVDWEHVFTRAQKDFGLRSQFRLADPASFPEGFTNGAEVTIGTFGMDDYAMLVQALKTVGDANLLSSPRITALNNQEAKILVGESRPYATNTVVTPAAGATTTASTLSFLDVGVKLYVTPSISQDGFITMKIKPEVSSSTTDYTYGDPATTVPIVSTTQAETSVRVKDGSTIIIAGLIKDERSGAVSKIPFLGDVPLLGNLFKKTDRSVDKLELVIFITPHIISGESDFLQAPQGPPVGDKKFTIPEGFVYERRAPEPMDPTLFTKKAVSSRSKAMADSLTRLSPAGSAEEYYYMVKNEILSHMDLSRRTLPHGDIRVSFRLSSTGELVSGPSVTHFSDEILTAPVLEAVQDSAPFPAFPELIRQHEKDFTMDFVFE